MLTNIKYIHLNIPNYLGNRLHNKQLYVGPFQVLINFLNSFKVTQLWMSVGKLFQYFLTFISERNYAMSNSII